VGRARGGGLDGKRGFLDLEVKNRKNRRPVIVALEPYIQLQNIRLEREHKAAKETA